MHGILGELYYNVDFSVAAIIVDLILFIYVRVKYSDISISNKIYKSLVIVAVIGSILNVTGAVMLTYSDKLPEFLVLFVNAVYYNFFLALAYTFSEYIESFFHERGKRYSRNKLNIALFVVGSLLIYVLVFTGNIFEIGSKGIEYHNMRYALYVLPLYFVGFAVFKFLTKHRQMKTDTIARILVAGGAATILMTLQTTFAPNTLLTDLFIAIALLVFFFTLESPEMFNNLSMQTMKTLAGTIDARDATMSGHSFRVADVGRLIAEKLGINEQECDNVYRIGLLHDIGKIGIPDTVLYNEGDLSSAQYEQAKEHTVIGDQILSHITELPELREGARWHHERYDGKGYPDGLKGKEIPLGARIIAVADAYDAMVAQRRYGKRLTQEEARAEIVKGSGTQFDPDIASMMVEIIDDDKDFELNGDKHTDEFSMELDIG